MRIALFSDIHALADTYRAAVEAAQAVGFDRLVVMGDLLSYGTQVEEAIAITEDLQDRFDAVLLVGNHDQLYFDLARGDGSYLDGKPDWIVETVNWTMDRIAGTSLSECLAWQEDLVVEDVLISHANPFGSADWTYIRDGDSAFRAAQALGKRELNFGVFGHVHRNRTYRFDALPTVATVGSIGQPREAGGTPEWAMLTIDEKGTRMAAHNIPFDREAHVARLVSTGMSHGTVERLASFFA